jgi:hypothetical protein
MSTRNPTPTAATELSETLRTAPGRLVGYCLSVVRAIAFWIGALSPLAYLPLFLTRTVTDPVAFVAALAVNAVCLVCGHTHGRA